MKITVTETMFIDEFRKIRPDNFSYEGLKQLFNCLTEMESDCESDMELDVIAICCDFSEASPKEIAEANGIEYTNDGELLEWLSDKTFIVGICPHGEIVYQNF